MFVTSMINIKNGSIEPENKSAIKAPRGNAISVVLVPIIAEAVPAMCPIGEMAMAFMFPNRAPKMKKVGSRKDMTLKVVVSPPVKKKVRKIVVQISKSFRHVLTILIGSNCITNFALIIDPHPTARAPALK